MQLKEMKSPNPCYINDSGRKDIMVLGLEALRKKSKIAGNYGSVYIRGTFQDPENGKSNEMTR